MVRGQALDCGNDESCSTVGVDVLSHGPMFLPSGESVSEAVPPRVEHGIDVSAESFVRIREFLRQVIQGATALEEASIGVLSDLPLWRPSEP